MKERIKCIVRREGNTEIVWRREEGEKRKKVCEGERREERGRRKKVCEGERREERERNILRHIRMRFIAQTSVSSHS